MAPMDNLRITVDASGLSLRRPRRSIRKTDLPDLPEEDEFLDDVACLELSLIPLTLEGGRENRLKEHLEQAGGPETVAHRIGTRLFELIFPTQAFVESYHGVRDDAEGMRLILEFALDPQESDSPVSRWAALPWEYLWDPEMAEFVALRPNCYLIRRLSSGGRVRPFTAPAPLKVVALLAELWGVPLPTVQQGKVNTHPLLQGAGRLTRSNGCGKCLVNCKTLYRCSFTICK